MTERQRYILRLAVQLAIGGNAETAAEDEREEARGLLDSIGVLLPENVPAQTMAAAA